MDERVESGLMPIEPQPQAPFWAPFVEAIEQDRSTEAAGAPTLYCYNDPVNGLDWLDFD